jgi:hypothetical protein
MSGAVVSLAPANAGEAVIDAQSPVHFLVGFTAGILKVDPHLAVLVFIGAKVVEQALRSGPGHALLKREQGQSLGNELSDLLFEMGGLTVGEKLREHLDAQQEPTAGIGEYFVEPMQGFGYVRNP